MRKLQKMFGGISPKVILVFSLVWAIALVYMISTYAGGSATKRRVLVGAYNPMYGSLADLESKIGSRFDSFLWYSAITQDFDQNLASNLKAENKSLQLAWEPRDPVADPINQPSYSLKAISGGVHDQAIIKWARSLRDSGITIYFRPMSEMNGNWASWDGTVNGNSPTDFIPAWRHIHDIFVTEGARNVKWVWSVNNISVPGAAENQAKVYYPGDKYVDFVGISGYNWNGPWQSFSEVFGPSYASITKITGRPMIIPETSCPEDARKGDWFTTIASDIKSKYPRIKQVYFFSAQKERDWRIDSSEESLSGFKSFLAGIIR